MPWYLFSALDWSPPSVVSREISLDTRRRVEGLIAEAIKRFLTNPAFRCKKSSFISNNSYNEDLDKTAILLYIGFMSRRRNHVTQRVVKDYSSS